MVGIAQANLLVFDNADFENGLTGWGVAGDVAFSAPATGGNPDGYGIMDGVAGGWGVLVATDAGIPLASLGVSAGDTITVEMDMILLGGAGNPGIKIESWAGGGHISNTGDLNGAITSEWATYSWDYTIDAGADALKFVPLWGGGASVGYDNLSIVPEPATMVLLGLGGLLLRRKK
jgi:hypothetical protein